MRIRYYICGAAMLAMSSLAPSSAPLSSARAAESYDNCNNFIDTVPATVNSQGVWCLRHDVNTALTGGAAINVQANNVTIDCNNFKLGGLSAGAATSAWGIQATDRLNTTVRHCNIRGFAEGIYFTGASGGGHVVEDNRFDGNTYTSIYVEGDGSVVRRNAVHDTGGSTFASYVGQAQGIRTTYDVDILDNSFDGIAPAADGSSNGSAWGIISYSSNGGSAIKGNHVRGLAPLGAGASNAIYSGSSSLVTIDDNDLIGSSAGNGITCSGTDTRARDNIVKHFTTGLNGCGDAGGNDITP